MAKQITFSDLVKKYGDIHSNKVFQIDDYKDYLFNEYLDRN